DIRAIPAQSAVWVDRDVDSAAPAAPGPGQCNHVAAPRSDEFATGALPSGDDRWKLGHRRRRSRRSPALGSGGDGSNTVHRSELPQHVAVSHAAEGDQTTAT